MAIAILSGGPAVRDAQGRLPVDEAPLKTIHVLAAAAVLGGAVLDGYVLGIVGPALSLAGNEMQLSALAQGLIASSALIGIFVGGLFFGNLADRFGRRPVFGWNLAAFILLSLMQLFVQDVWQLVALRLALGLAVGVEYAVGSSVLAEFSRRRGRGMLLGSFSIGWQVGFTLAFIVGALYQGDNWRMLLATSAVPAIITFVLRMTLPETPMWLQARGRKAEARAVVDRHFGKEFYIPEIELGAEHASPRELFTARTWRQSLYSGLFWFCQVGPFFGIFTFMMPVLQSLGVEESGSVDMWLNAIQIAGAFAGMLLLHWMSRRGFVIWTFAIILLTLLGLGLFPQAPAWIVLGLFGIYMFVAPAANDIQYVYPPEIFDTHVRATGVGFSAAFSRISAAGVTFLLPWLMQTFGFSATLTMMAGFPLLGLVLSIMWAPETKGKHLS
ncbi:MFS transporter [Paracoccus versutus]